MWLSDSDRHQTRCPWGQKLTPSVVVTQIEGYYARGLAVTASRDVVTILYDRAEARNISLFEGKKNCAVLTRLPYSTPTALLLITASSPVPWEPYATTKWRPCYIDFNTSRNTLAVTYLGKQQLSSYHIPMDSSTIILSVTTSLKSMRAPHLLRATGVFVEHGGMTVVADSLIFDEFGIHINDVELVDDDGRRSLPPYTKTTLMALDACSIATSVDAVLQDAAALQAFREWIRLDPSRPSDCLALHFAVKGYQAYLARREPSTSSMACSLHRKFISQRTGTCSFLPSSVRKEVSARVHSLSSQQPPYPELFDPIQPFLRKQLTALHAQFIASDSFLAFLARNCSEGSSATTPLDECHLKPYPDPGPTATLAREPARKARGSKDRAYSCGASTSRDTDVTSRAIAVDRERNLFKHTDGSIRHDLPEAREAFASVLIQRLEVISKELDGCDDNTFARDLPRDLATSSFLPSLHDNRILEETTSDEEVEKYVGRIDGTRRRSESSSPVMFNFRHNTSNPYENGFAPPPEEFLPPFPELPAPPVFPVANKSLSYRFSDSSGFCSSESAYFSDRSFGGKKMSFEFRTNQMGSNSISRSRHPTIAMQDVFGTLHCRTTSSPQMTLVLRENGQPPMVAKIPSAVITLAKFRRTFGVSRTSNSRFLFKSTCEDGTSPFQWSLITDDDAIVPLFDGKITAECRHFAESD